MSKSYLVTGGSGFLGINLIRHLLSNGQRVTLFDTAPFRYNDVKDNVRTIAGDIRLATRGIEVGKTRLLP